MCMTFGSVRQDEVLAAAEATAMTKPATLPGHALLIGVSNYTSGWDQLPSVKDNLEDVKEGILPHFQTVETL